MKNGLTAVDRPKPKTAKAIRRCQYLLVTPENTFKVEAVATAS
jgi:hypothetical protein